MRARMESDYQELQVIVEHMDMKQEALLATMERKQKLMGGAQEDPREKLFKEVRILDDRISVEEAEVHDDRAETEELLKERKRTKADELRASDAVRSDVARRAASGVQSSKTEVGLSDVSRVDVDWLSTLGDQSSMTSAGGLQKKRKAVVR